MVEGMMTNSPWYFYQHLLAKPQTVRELKLYLHKSRNKPQMACIGSTNLHKKQQQATQWTIAKSARWVQRLDYLKPYFRNKLQERIKMTRRNKPSRRRSREGSFSARMTRHRQTVRAGSTTKFVVLLSLSTWKNRQGSYFELFGHYVRTNIIQILSRTMNP